jgi:SAM-dependent methyltransferase
MDNDKPTGTVARETLHTVSLIEPYLEGCESVLDVGCGAGYVAAELMRRFAGEVWTVDIADFRAARTPNFTIFDGVHLPFPDGSFDLVVFSFVLHHVPDVLKPLLLAEARRVARRRIFVLEDTPITLFDRLASWRHGERFRRKIRSRESFGFLDCDGWLRLFRLLDLRPVYLRRLSRWCRSIVQPFARSMFVVEVEPPSVRPPLLAGRGAGSSTED